MEIIPNRFLCPVCHEYHLWFKDQEIQKCLYRYVWIETEFEEECLSIDVYCYIPNICNFAHGTYEHCYRWVVKYLRDNFFFNNEEKEVEIRLSTPTFKHGCFMCLNRADCDYVNLLKSWNKFTLAYNSDEAFKKAKEEIEAKFKKQEEKDARKN